MQNIFSKSNRLFLLACYFWAFPVIRMVLSKLFLTFLGTESPVDYSAFLGIPLLYLAFFGNSRGKIKSHETFAYIGIVALYILHLALYPENQANIIKMMFSFLVCSLPCFFAGELLDFKQLIKPFYKITIVVIFGFAWYTMLHKTARADYEGGAEDMYFAYMLLPHVIYMIWYAFTTVKLIDILLSVFGVFLLLSMGTRGPMVCLFFFMVFFILFVYNRVKRSTKIFVSLFAIAGLTIFIMIGDEAMLFLQSLLARMGLSTRILDMSMDAQFMGGESVMERDYLRYASLEALKEDRIFGYGFAGSYGIMRTYPHNLAFELWLTFGVYVGSIILLSIIIVVARAFYVTKDGDKRGFLLLWVSCGFVSYFMSRTFLGAPDIFVMLGYSLLLIRENRRNHAAIKDSRPVNVLQ